MALFLVRRRQDEAQLLFARGERAPTFASRIALESLLPVAVGGAAGFGIALLALRVAAPAGTQPSAGSVIVTDAIPSGLALFVGTYAPGPGPVAFGTGTSGLTYNFAGLASSSDDIAFSNNGGASWTYVPTPDANGVDAAVTHVRINPKGSMAPGSSFTINLRAQVK